MYEEIKPSAIKDVDLELNKVLFEKLRQLRKRIADEQNVPPYIIFQDKTLKEMAAQIPTRWSQLQRIYGMGESKLKRYGPRFLKEMFAHAQQIGLEITKVPEPASAGTRAATTEYQTLESLRQGLSIRQVAEQRNLSVRTIYGHIERLIMLGEPIVLTKFIPLERQQRIREAFHTLGLNHIEKVKKKLADDILMEELRLVRAKLLVEKKGTI